MVSKRSTRPWEPRLHCVLNYGLAGAGAGAAGARRAGLPRQRRAHAAPPRRGARGPRGARPGVSGRVLGVGNIVRAHTRAEHIILGALGVYFIYLHLTQIVTATPHAFLYVLHRIQVLRELLRSAGPLDPNAQDWPGATPHHALPATSDAGGGTSAGGSASRRRTSSTRVSVGFGVLLLRKLDTF